MLKRAHATLRKVPFPETARDATFFFGSACLFSLSQSSSRALALPLNTLDTWNIATVLYRRDEQQSVPLFAAQGANSRKLVINADAAEEQDATGDPRAIDRHLLTQRRRPFPPRLPAKTTTKDRAKTPE